MQRTLRTRGVLGMATIVALVGLAAGRALASEKSIRWAEIRGPSPGPARTIGSYGSGCISGAMPLPPEGAGYQAVDLERNRHYGHPSLVAFLGDLGRRAAAADLGTLLVGDMAQPRGGPMSSGHVSHQTGLDVDVWFRLDVPPLPRDAREGMSQPEVVDPATGRVDPALFGDSHAEMIHLAAIDPRVDRVFVGAAVKHALCERDWDDRRFLRRVRTWPGHDEHMHVRLRCPEDSPRCVPQRPLPGGEGCGASLERRLGRRRTASTTPSGKVPPACRQLLETL
jgi:penicillin-insensitive murein DD-endopeptidase